VDSIPGFGASAVAYAP